MSLPSLEEARAVLTRRLSADSLAHSERVAETAALLAERYGVDIEEARLAGLLHDWSRDLPEDVLLDEVLTAGAHVADADRRRPYLLHAQVGADQVREAFPGISGEVVDAVARHTMGAVEMTDLDKIVFLADAMETARSNETAEELRREMERVDLDELFRIGYSGSVRHLVDARKPIHPMTVRVWNALVAGETT